MSAQPSSRPRPNLPAATVFSLATLTALAPLGIDMYLAALPGIAQDLATTPAYTQLTLTAFMLGFSALALVCLLTTPRQESDYQLEEKP